MLKPSRFRRRLMAATSSAGFRAGLYPLGVLLILSSTAAAQTPSRPVTFTKDVAPIFRDKCEACHRAESMAPMPLTTYDEVRPWARSIRARVATGVTEPRWVRAIEIRPSTMKGRRITHHALARLRQEENPEITRLSGGTSSWGPAGLFMEWAIGKQGELMRPNSGKLMLPGST